MFDPLARLRRSGQHLQMIRAADADDAASIARVLVATWEGTYRGLMPDEVIDGLTLERRTRSWTRELSRVAPRGVVFVATHNGLVGVAGVGPTRDDDLDAQRVGEIRLIYVAPDHWGHGHGRGLMVRSLAWLGGAGFTEAMLWVLDTNTIGRTFYERGGWRCDDTIKIDDSFGAPLREVRYRIDLDR